MTNRPFDNNNILKDIGWYLTGAAVPIFVSVLRSPVFTRYFTPEEYGNFSIVFITISIASVFLYTWLSNSVWRFYFKYKKSGELGSFYSGLLLLIFITTILFTFIIFPWAYVQENEVITRLIILIFVQTFINQFVSLVLIVIRLENRSGLYNTIHSIRAVLSFMVQLLLTFHYQFRIEAIPIATILTEFLILAVMVGPVLKNIKINFKKINKAILKEIIKFSIPGIVTNLSIILLTSGDRYIISIFCDMGQVGIYNQVYNFSQISIMALVQVFFSVINPEFLKTLEYHPEKITSYMFQYYKYYLILILPIVFYISIFARPVSVIFFGEDFREGWDMIPFVAFSAFINGYIFFRDNKFKFEKKYKTVIIGFVIATSTNIALNFIFIPLLGYKVAAITTLFSYFVLYLFYYLNDDVRLIRNHKYLTVVIKTVLVLFVQAVIDYTIRKLFNIELNLLFSIVEGILFMLVYIFVIVRPNVEFKHLINQAKRSE